MITRRVEVTAAAAPARASARPSPLAPRFSAGPIGRVLDVFRGRGAAGDTTGNSPGSKWVAFSAIAEHLDYGQRYSARTNQVQRSLEDTSLKQRALELVIAA